MTKPRGPICNLDCKYCYYLSKEKLYPGSTFRMSDALLDTFTREYIESQHTPEVIFAWQGGEPTLMGLDFFRRAVTLQQTYRKPDTHIRNALQTNGLFLDDAWCAFLREHDFLVGVSIDGPRACHDTYRVDKGGRPTHARVLDAIRLLQRHGVEFNTLTTVHRANVEHPLAVYRFLRDHAQSRYLQFIPIVERDNETGYQEGSQLTRRSVRAAAYGRFLARIFDEWVRRDVGAVFVQMFDVALAAWSGRSPGLCVFEETCGNAMAMEHNGDLYACDHYVQPSHLLGNIAASPMARLATSPAQHAFGTAKRDTLPRMCRACDVRFVCNGGCPKDRTAHTPDGEAGLNALCEGYKHFFHHIDAPMRFMAAELNAGRAPANIMRWMEERERAATRERQARQTGRNDACPCGSGRKFKHCHGQTSA